MKKKYIVLILCMMLVLPLSKALAHKVVLFAWAEDGQLHVEGSFGSDRKARNCKITISDKAGKIIHTMQTDMNGDAATPLKPEMMTDLIVTLDAGPGHRGVWNIPKAEVLAANFAPSTDEDKAKVQEKLHQLEQGPSLARIVGGIGMIFGLALMVILFKKNKRKVF